MDKTLKLAATPRTRIQAVNAASALSRAGWSASVGDDEAPDRGRPPLLERLEALDAGSVDLLVAPASRLPVPFPDGLALGGVLTRQEARDVLVNRGGRPGTLAHLPPGATVGVQGGRRFALLLAHRPDLDVRRVPGDAPALGKALAKGRLQSIILSARDARDQGMIDEVGEALERKAWLPDPGQGAVALVCRNEDEAATAAAAALNDATSLATVTAERAVMRAMGAVPGSTLGALALPMDKRMRLWAMVASRRGDRVVRGDLTGSADNPGALGRALAKLLLKRGGADVLEASGGVP